MRLLNKINKASVYYELIKVNKTDSIASSDWLVRGKDIKVRQVLAEKIQRIPPELKSRL